MIQVSGIDHIVLTVSDIERSLSFYTGVLGMEKINLHQTDTPASPKSRYPTIGCADLCLIIDTPLETVILELQEKGIPIVKGIVQRTGATGKLRSLYLNDPDGNLIELANSV